VIAESGRQPVWPPPLEGHHNLPGKITSPSTLSPSPRAKILLPHDNMDTLDPSDPKPTAEVPLLEGLRLQWNKSLLRGQRTTKCKAGT
jgi:hypothetical protein